MRLRTLLRLGLGWVVTGLVAEAAGLVNLSARGVTGAGEDTLTAGFAIAGDGAKRVLLRAAGPALTGLGVPGALASPRLELFRGSVPVAANTAWDAGPGAEAVREAVRAAAAFPFAAGSRDAALVLALEPGNYTAQITAGAGGSAGVALVEIYDVDPFAPARLVNLSARGRAGAGAATFIAGFVVAGADRNRMLVRGIGPAIGALGVGGALADPQLEVFRQDSSVAFNDDWQASAQPARMAEVAQRAGAFALVEAGRDAAILLPGAQGAYTAHVTAASDGGSGVALVEVYDTAGQRDLPAARDFDLVGFGRVPGHGVAVVTGGGAPTSDYDPVTRTGNFWRIDDATVAAAGPGFAAQLQAAFASDQALVIELDTMLDLARFGRPNSGATAIAHPDLFTAGRNSGTVGALAIGSNKTIYSAYGSGGFRRGSLSIAGKNNVVLRNLRFRELWEWDDATAGEYDRNDWDYLTVASTTSGANVTARAHHVWIDHCDFEKSYDGIFDFVRGTDLVTVSWCRIGGVVSGETARWVRRQMDYLEANRAAFPYYSAQRTTTSAAELLRRELFQKKSNLVGNGTDATTAALDVGYLNVTFHHNAYLSVDQRMPRLRFGNAHVFNLLADSRAGRGVSGLSQAGVAATSNAAVRLEHARFVDVRTPLTTTAGTEPAGRIAVIGSVNLDSLTGLDRGFDASRRVAVEEFRWNPPATATGLLNWPLPDSSVMPAGYVPVGGKLADYVDPQDALPAALDRIGVIVPADATDAEQLRRRLQTTTAQR